jgi:type IV pilus assembly protein PilV
MLIALLVLSFGLLGMAGLQTHSLRNNTSAYQRSQATALAYDVVDRMRANRMLAVGAEPGKRPTTTYASPYNLTLGSPPSGSGIARLDLDEWTALVAGRLPNGAGAVACDGATAVCTVSVQWNDGRVGGARPACDAANASGPWTCFVFSTEL